MEKGVAFPESLEHILIERALGAEAAEKARFGKLSAGELQPIVTAMLELSDWFNGLSDKPGPSYMQSRWHRAAYFLYFLPANVIKARTVVSELSRTFCGLEEVSFLDVGSGPGSATLGALDFLARETDVKRIRAEAVDSSSDALSDWRRLVDRYQKALAEEGRGVTLSVRTHAANVTAAPLPAGPWDVIFFGDTVNELFGGWADPVEARGALVAKAAENLSDGGSIVIVEPALKATSRALADLRDTLTRVHGFSIYAPCPTGGACPLAEEGRERDWCHTGVVWARPKIVRRIDQLADRKKLVAKFSYCIARRREEHPVEPGPGETMFRVAGEVLEEKGKRHALLCGLPGCLKFTLLDRDETEANEEFRSLCRGDMVAVDKWDERKDGPRLGRESRVRVLRRFA
jgi:SAM-dependent methyltransferase